MFHAVDVLERAIESHRAGRLPEAASLYRNLLLADPKNADALHLLGVLMHQIHQSETAVELISRAIQINPLCAPFHLNLGNALLASQGKDAAARSYQTAAACDPLCLDAHINLGNIALSDKHYQEAAENYGRAVQSDPTCRDALVLLGVASIEAGDTQHAVSALDSALKVDPRHALAHMFRGYAQARAGDYASSLPFYQEAIRLEPLRDEAHNNLGAAYEGLGRYSEAASAFATALALKPSSVEYLVNVGLNMARRKDRGGIAYLQRATAVDSNHAEAHTTLGETLLAFGDWERGWQEYEWRWHKPEFVARKRPFHQPRWDGSPLEGKTILLHAEQGYGDTIQFARFLPQVERRGGKIVLEVQQGLHSLLAGLPGVRLCLRQGIDPLPVFDVHCPLMTLPLALGSTCSSAPPPLRIPSFTAARLSSFEDTLRVGLAWRGNPNHIRDSFRSTALHHLSPLRSVHAASFVCLQKPITDDEAEAIQNFPMERPLTPDGDFLATAEILNDLDLLISVDTSVAHLAASMGRPVWLLLPEAADWRWGIDGERTVWYPSMTLFRQRSEGDWTELTERVVGRLKSLALDRSSAHPHETHPGLSNADSRT